MLDLTSFEKFDTMYFMKTKTLPTLYGHTTAAAIKVWNCRIEDHGTESHIIITHGLEHGKQQETTRRVKEGKNIGRANATTSWTQAVAEAEAFAAKKINKGYNSTKVAAATQQQQTRLPMLALKYEDRLHDIVWPAFVQPKLNGVRCLMERRGNEIIFHSRGNKQFSTLTHLKADALAVLKDGDILDGELYNHGEITFQKLVGLIKREIGDPAKVTKFVRFWNYDRCEDVPFVRRASRLVEHGNIKRVPTYRVSDHAEMRQRHVEFMQNGYEGTMVRSGGTEPYRFQYRSSSLLKVKDFLDAEFEIIGANEGVGKSEGQATFICKMRNGVTFDARCKGTDEQRREQWTNRQNYVGKMLTVKYQCLSDAGIPVFPVGITVRDYE